MHTNLARSVSFSRPSNAVAAGTTDVEATGVDMADYEGVIFIALLGTLTATQVTTLEAEQSDALASGYTAITGATSSAMADDDDNQIVVLDIFRPRKRYVRPVLDRGTANAVLDGIVAIRYGCRKLPAVDDSATVFEKVTLVPTA